VGLLDGDEALSLAALSDGRAETLGPFCASVEFVFASRKAPYRTDMISHNVGEFFMNLFAPVTHLVQPYKELQ